MGHRMHLRKEQSTNNSYVQMADEEQRRRTFSSGWPHSDSLSASRMAQSGFFYIADYDRVQCPFCEGILYDWPSASNPMAEHAKAFPFCSFVKEWKRQSTDIISQGLALVNNLPDVACSRCLPTNVLIHVYVVVHYTPDENPPIPHEMQRNLQEMQPAKFLDYVMNRISHAEREALMHDERNRLKSFAANWPYGDRLSGLNMAKAGFYYVNQGDKVACAFCLRFLEDWQPYDEPMAEHIANFPSCGFVKGLDCGNRAYRPGMEHADFERMALFCKNLIEKMNQNSDPNELSRSLGIDQSHANYQRFAIPMTRFNTYDSTWPNSSVSVDKLTDAGFFYTGQDDLVRCFYCSGSLRNWTDKDVPAEEHIRYFPKCSFAVNHQNNTTSCQFSNMVASHKSAEERDTSTEGDYPLDLIEEFRLLCKACRKRMAEFVSLPCGHLLYCTSCNAKEEERFNAKQNPETHVCRMCRKKVRGTVKIFFT